ncbi:hypothetical protein EJ02DRAFT_404080 [Clathrospora elynae]|uniref:Uncharacterized protein n=1 Tax=Clathrospora elynae TaxID=706981 RepID=A0A6A5SQB8_9PLEO|nr:hypothetical protein EJ02DRAFT_404080 [Clathrospora elynae]
MSRITCVWADLGDDADADEWYESTHIPDVVAKLETTARSGDQAEDNVFKEVAGIDGTYMTIYDLPDGVDAKDLDAQICPALDKLPTDARLDARCYTEYASWDREDWRGDSHDIQMWIVVLWQPALAIHDEFVKWFQTEFTPGLLESPELLRTRIFKLENASLVKDQKHEQVDTESMYQYMTFWEFDCDELPWEILVYLGSSERWRYYIEGGHVKWQIGQYLVNRMYPGGVGSPAVKRTSIVLNGERKGATNDSDSEADIA